MTTGKKQKNKKLDAELGDMLFDDFDRFEYFAVTYWKQIIALALFVVVAVTVFFSVKAWRDSASRQAAAALNNADTETAILAALEQHSGYPASSCARLRLAGIYLKEGKYDDALEQYRLLIASDIPDEMRWRLQLATGYIHEKKNNFKEAAESFAVLGRNSFIPEALRNEANFSAGRIHAQYLDREAAKSFLERVTNTKSQGAAMGFDASLDFWKRQAEFLLNLLQSGTVIAAESAHTSAPTGEEEGS